MSRAPLRGLGGLARALRSERDWLGIALVAVIVAHALVAVATGLSPDVARWCMRRFHLGSASFGGWASYQLGPWMYNFDNQVLVSARPLDMRALAAPDAPFWYINHQSARVITFADHRPLLLAQPGERFVYLRSRYRAAEVLSGFRLRVHATTRPYRASVTPLGPVP